MAVMSAQRRRALYLASYYDQSVPSGPVAADGESFDPGDHTVAEVEAHLADHPDERDAIRAAELEGKARVTLLAALEPDDEPEPEDDEDDEDDESESEEE